MRNRTALVTVCMVIYVGILAFGGVSAQDATATPEETGAQQPIGSALLNDVNGMPLGGVVFTAREDGKVLVTANLVDLPPGFHGFHLHDYGSCDMEDAFAWASGHLNLEDGAQHPDHSGDFPPLLVAADGTAFLSFATDRITLDSLFPGEGTSVVVHASPDNFANVPARYSGMTDSVATPDPAMMPAPMTDEETLMAGDSGERIACGVVEQGFLAVFTDALPTADPNALPADATTVPDATADLTLSPELTLTGVDLTLTPDLTVTQDVTPDLTLTPDLTVTVDVTATVDTTLTVVPPDLTLTPDLTVTVVETIETGVPLEPSATPPPG